MTEQSAPTDAALPHQLPQANASTLIYNGAGAYLLHLRDDIPGIWEPGAWSLLGGGREPGDRSLEETARRELREEAGLELPDLAPFAVEQARGSDGGIVPIQIFTGRWEGDPATLNLTEGIMLHWFRPEVMPRLRMAPSTRNLIRRHAELLRRNGLETAAQGGARNSSPVDRPSPLSPPPEAEEPFSAADRPSPGETT
ncbi:NUDIX domain-containing protein [Streptomyces sp. Edi2]|uniref:NUDIX domain-containing protein n=1 Tax=Streptomyces sp. Edi2 TaxID=3162528 RepID=UPI003305886D